MPEFGQHCDHCRGTMYLPMRLVVVRSCFLVFSCRDLRGSDDGDEKHPDSSLVG